MIISCSIHFLKMSFHNKIVFNAKENCNQEIDILMPRFLSKLVLGVNSISDKQDIKWKMWINFQRISIYYVENHLHQCIEVKDLIQESLAPELSWKDYCKWSFLNYFAVVAVFVLGDRISLCNPDYSGLCCVDQAGPKFKDPPAWD